MTNDECQIPPPPNPLLPSTAQPSLLLMNGRYFGTGSTALFPRRCIIHCVSLIAHSDSAKDAGSTECAQNPLPFAVFPLAVEGGGFSQLEQLFCGWSRKQLSFPSSLLWCFLFRVAISVHIYLFIVHFRFIYSLFDTRPRAAKTQEPRAERVRDCVSCALCFAHVRT